MDRAAADSPNTRALSWLLAVLALVAAWGSITMYLGWVSNRDDLLTLLGDAGIAEQPVLERVRREPVVHHAQLDAARAMVFALLQAPALESLPAAERSSALASRRAHLESAHALARSALTVQPNSWEAAMLQGATTYLLWSLERDRRLFTASETWQEPLIKAWREAPGRSEPRRILGTAYLELWPALSADKQRFATELLATTFAEDADAFQRLGPVWLETLSDTDRALEIIPDTPRAWDRTSRYFAERGQWSRYRDSHLRGLDSLERQLAATLADGERRLTLGDVFTSRTRFARVIGDAPPDLRFVPYVDRALGLYPAGLQTAGTGDTMEHWLLFAIELSAVGLPSLEPRSIDRLGGVVQGLSPADAALAALAGGDPSLAERLERLERSHSSAAWTPYLIAKARWLSARGSQAESAATLDRIGTLRPLDAAYWSIRQAVALAQDDRPHRLEAELWLSRIAAESWPPDEWAAPTAGPSRGQHRLVMLAARDASGLDLEIAGAPATGAVVRIRLDGASVLVAPVGPRVRSLRVEAAVTSGLHLLDWSTLAGGETSPGAVALAPP